MDFPLAPEKLVIRKEMLAPETQDFLDHHNISFSPQTRLTQTFLPKKNYIVHIKTLKHYLEQGMVLERVHRGIKFYQSEWMQSYIDLCTQKRIDSVSKFEKDFFKLLVSVRNRISTFIQSL